AFAVRAMEIFTANGIRAQFVDQVTPTPLSAEITRASLPVNKRVAVALHFTASHNPVYYTFDELQDPKGNSHNGAMWMGIKIMKNGRPASDAYTGAIAARANDKTKNASYMQVDHRGDE